jgi:hypothetical protein
MTSGDLDYYRRRELQERTRAEHSEDQTARRLHREMADRYSEKLRDAAGATTAEAL